MLLFYKSIRILIQIMELLIVVRILFSFLNISGYNFLVSFVYEMTEPILEPARSLIQRLGIRTGMFDFSPLLAVLFLRIISDFIRVRLM